MIKELQLLQLPNQKGIEGRDNNLTKEELEFILNPLLFYSGQYNYLNNVLPYSVGFEVECVPKENIFNIKNFSNIPYIMDYSGESEVRFRIPNGIKGMICLYFICERLKINNELNPLSGIHYHIDTRSLYRNLILSEKEYILKELDTWEYTGTYNKRDIKSSKGNWVNIGSGFNTIEFRIGEMSFDYSLILHRMNHCSALINYVYLKHEKHDNVEFSNDYNIKDTYNYIKNLKYDSSNLKLYELLNKFKSNIKENKEEQIEQIVKSRMIYGNG